MVHRALLGFVCAAAAFTVPSCLSQSLPVTAGETVSGRRIVLSEAVRGHQTVLVAAFSRAGSSGASAWARAVHADSALAGSAVYQIAMLEPVPNFARRMIESTLRRKLSAAEQDNFVVLTQDEKLWQSYFEVTSDHDPYVVFIDANGKVIWHGHGPASLEPELKAVLH